MAELPVKTEDPKAIEAPDWRLGGSPDPTTPGAKPLSTTLSRHDKVWAWKMRGISVEQIGAHLGVSKDTVYRDIKKYVSEYREHLETDSPANMIAEQMQFLQNMEDMCLFEANQTDANDELIDSTTGQIVRRPSKCIGKNNERVSLLMTALKARDMRMKLLLETGLIPKDLAGMYKSLLEQATPEDDGLRKDVAARSREDILKSITDHMKHGQKL